MRRSLALLTAAVLAVPAPLALLATTAPAARAEPAPVAVAVVDMLTLINAHPEFKRAKDLLDTRLKAAETARKAAEDDVKKDEAVLDGRDGIAKGDPRRAAAEKGLQVRRITAKFNWEWELKIAQDEYMRALISIHGKVVALVAAYARNNKIGLVLQMTNEPVTGKSPDEFIPNVVVRGVIHFEPALDITKAVAATFPPAPPAPVPEPAAPAPEPAPGAR